jgi:hypothetical protein
MGAAKRDPRLSRLIAAFAALLEISILAWSMIDWGGY